MKACPSPMTLELSNEMRDMVSSYISDEMLQQIESSRSEFLERITLRLLLLPSGSELPNPLRTPPGAMAHGKLLYGGVTRYRMIGSTSKKRRAGERNLIYDDSVASWLQYGGPERNYQAIDMGPCALVELTLTPKGLSLPLLSEGGGEECMSLCNVGWNPEIMFDFVQETNTKEPNATLDDTNDGPLSDSQSSFDMFQSTFTSSVGGLRPQIDAIVRRVLDGRVIRPATSTDSASVHHERSKEAKVLAELGLDPVRGLLLYGPPGCGKVSRFS